MKNTKQCNTCNTIKEISEFYTSKQTKDGLTYRCKTCKSIYVKEYRERNAQKMREWANESYARHKPARNMYNKKYNELNRDKMNEWKRAYHHKNKDKDWYIVSKRNSGNKRRAIKRSTSDGTIPYNVKYPLNTELETLLGLQGNKCYICDTDLNKGKHLDHHVPLSRGGTHTIDNVVWLCPTCNRQKFSKVPCTLLLI